MSDLAALFPGQGSQHVGMGAELAGTYVRARAVFERADQVLGWSLSRLCWEGPEEELIQTQNAQPAILVHGYAVWSIVEERLGEHVRFAAGHSLGEFSAYAAAGALQLEDAVRLVRRRGELMAESREGTMSALIGLDDIVVEELCRDIPSDVGTVVPANYNAPGQVVVSGDIDAVARVEELARERGARMVRRLQVSGAFHSPLMSSAEEGLKGELERTDFGQPKFPIISNVTAEPVTDSATARQTLVSQLTAPVRWKDSIRYMADHQTGEFIEMGPGRVLTGLLRRIDARLEARSIGSPSDIEAAREAEA
jgi:[acyl-carrier-protein] S-malonyltransferase